MRLLIDVRKDDHTELEALAWSDHRSVREQAAYLLAEAIRAARKRRQDHPRAATSNDAVRRALEPMVRQPVPVPQQGEDDSEDLPF